MHAQLMLRGSLEMHRAYAAKEVEINTRENIMHQSELNEQSNTASTAYSAREKKSNINVVRKKGLVIHALRKLEVHRAHSAKEKMKMN